MQKLQQFNFYQNHSYPIVVQIVGDY